MRDETGFLGLEGDSFGHGAVIMRIRGDGLVDFLW